MCYNTWNERDDWPSWPPAKLVPGYPGNPQGFIYWLRKSYGRKYSYTHSLVRVLEGKELPVEIVHPTTPCKLTGNSGCSNSCELSCYMKGKGKEGRKKVIGPRNIDHCIMNPDIKPDCITTKGKQTSLSCISLDPYYTTIAEYCTNTYQRYDGKNGRMNKILKICSLTIWVICRFNLAPEL